MQLQRNIRNNHNHKILNSTAIII